MSRRPGPGDHGGSLLHGTIDEFALWKIDLNANEIDRVYRRQSPIYSGTFTSRVMDGLAAAQSCTHLDWTTTMR